MGWGQTVWGTNWGDVVIVIYVPSPAHAPTHSQMWREVERIPTLITSTSDTLWKSSDKIQRTTSPRDCLWKEK